MKILSSAAMLASLFPVLAFAQNAIPNGTFATNGIPPINPAVVAPAAVTPVPAAEVSKDGVKFTWGITGNVRLYLYDSANNLAPYVALPTSHDDAFKEDKIGKTTTGFRKTGSCASVGDCLAYPQNLTLKTKATQGKYSIEVRLPLIEETVFHYAYDNDREANAQKFNFVDALVRRVTVLADYKDDIFYGRVGARIGDPVLSNAYSGVKLPTSANSSLDLRLGRWYETSMRVPTDAINYNATVAADGSVSIPTVGQTVDPFYLNGAKATYSLKLSEVTISPFVAFMNNIDQGSMHWKNMTFEPRTFAGGLNTEMVVGAYTIKPSVYALSGKHVWTDSGADALPSSTDPVIKAGKLPVAKAVAGLLVAQAKLGVETEGVSIEGYYWAAQVSKAKTITSAINGKIVTGAEIEDSDSKMVKLGLDIQADTSMLKIKNLWIENGKAVAGTSIARWIFEKKISESNETDSTVFVGFGNDTTTTKLTWEHWATPKGTYIVDSKGEKTPYWDAIYLSTEFSFN